MLVRKRVGANLKKRINTMSLVSTVKARIEKERNKDDEELAKGVEGLEITGGVRSGEAAGAAGTSGGAGRGVADDKAQSVPDRLHMKNGSNQ